MSAVRRIAARQKLTAKALDALGRVLVGIILSSAVLIMVAQHAGNRDAAGDFAFAFAGATLVLLLVEIFAARLARHG